MSSNNNRFASTNFITSTNNLRDILKRCKKCYKITMNASLIMPIESVSETRLPKVRFQKYFLLANFKTGENLGHWVGIAVFPHEKLCVIIDPGNRYRDYPIVVSHIQNFCKLNKLNIFDYATKFQQDSSFICGQLCTFFCAKIHLYSFQELLNFRDVIKSYTISSNEENMMSFVQKHFDISF